MAQLINGEWTLAIKGMSCASCSNRVEKAFSKVPGVLSAEVNLALETAQVIGAKDLVNSVLLIQAVVDAGYQAQLLNDDTIAVVTTMPGWPEPGGATP